MRALGQTSSFGAFPATKALRRGCALTAVLLAAACGSDEEETTAPEEFRVVVEEAVFGCPDVSILRDAAQRVTFAGGGRDLTNIVAEVEISDFNGECGYRETDVVVELTVEFLAIAGPQMTGDAVSFPYFVAILDPEDRVLAKQVFQASATIEEGDAGGVVREDLQQVIPLDRTAAGPAYQILLGFQLTPEELEYNRQSGGL